MPGWIGGVTASGSPYEPGVRWAIYRSRIGDYMDRFIVRTPMGTLRLHRILRADTDRDPHDHPFSFVSLVLWGGYVERLYRAEGARDTVRARGSCCYRQASDAHTIVSVLPCTWTLVVSGPHVKPWGYLTPDGWVYHRLYGAYKSEQGITL